jgi:tetratricopeptide (TPR) repeat protein
LNITTNTSTNIILIQKSFIAMKRVTTITSLALLLSASAFAQTINDGLKQIDLDDLAKARSIFSTYTKANATDADGFFHFGNVLSHQGKADSAKMMYTKAVEVNPKATMAYIAAGRLALANKDAKAATTAFDKGSRAGRKSSDTYRYIAESFVAAKDYAKAKEWFDMALDKDSKNARTYYAMGEMYFAQNIGGDAVTNFERANYYDKAWATPYLKVANIQRRAKNPKARLEALEGALKANPKQPAVYRELGEYYYDRAEFPKSKENYKKYMDMAGATEDMLVRYLNIIFYNKEYKEVFAIAEAILKKNAKKFAVYRAMAYAHTELDENEKSVAAMETFMKNTETKNLVATDYEYYGKALAKLKREPEANAAFDQAIVLDSTNFATPGIMAQTAFEKQDFKKAAKYYSLVADRKPDLKGQDLFNVGYSYFKDNDFTKAEEGFKRMIKLRPDGIAGYEWAAQAAMQLDPTSEKAAAKTYQEKVVELGAKDSAKYKDQLITAYGYLGGLACKAKDVANATANATKLLELNPASEQAKAILGGGCN